MKHANHQEVDKSNGASRREFLKRTGKVAAVGALAGAAVPRVHAAEDNTIRLALIGCGGRGSGAVANAISSPNGPAQLVAMADIAKEKLDASYRALSGHFVMVDDHLDRSKSKPSEKANKAVDVPPERRFIGFDAYRKAIDCLRPGDVAILATHAAFRAPHMEYAVEKGVNVFMEKNLAADPGGIKRILAAGEAAKKKNLKVATGLMCRHSPARQEMINRIRDGLMGQIQLIRAYRMDSGYHMNPPPQERDDLVWQVRHAYQFLWTSSGIFLELMVHQIDECCWLKDGWPVEAHGIGGRAANSTSCSQNLEAYAVEYTFADGTKAMVSGRYLPKCHNGFSTYVHGAKCAGQFSGNIHAPKVRTYKDQRIQRDNITWKAPKERMSPWQAEWDVLLDAIRNDKPHNEAERGAYSTLAGIMGRAAVHSGKIITWDEALASDFKFCPNIDDLDYGKPAPVTADAQGRYPVPVPGQCVEI